MKQIILALLLLFSLCAFAQTESELIEEPNPIEQKQIIFYKNSWKPFEGNTVFKNDDPIFIYKGKVKNGIEYYSEVYSEEDSLIDVLENGINLEFDSNSYKSKFHKNDEFSDINELKIKKFKLHYNQNHKTGIKKKINGIVKLDKVKYYYKKGALTKIETYYDKNYKFIKSSYEIFSTEFGNLFNLDVNSAYHGKYKLWNNNGQLIEVGKYIMGKKVKA